MVCKCQGYVLGGALELMLGCDLRVAANDTKFGMPEVRVGVPSVIEAALFLPFCGLGTAQDLLLTGRTFDAREAHRFGIIQRICPPPDLEETTQAAVAQLLEAAPGALRAQKALLRRWTKDYLARPPFLLLSTPSRLRSGPVSRRRAWPQRMRSVPQPGRPGIS